MSKPPVFLSDCCQAAVGDGVGEAGAPIQRCKNCLRPCMAVRYVPHSIIRTLISYCESAPPHVITADEIKRVCMENGIPSIA